MPARTNIAILILAAGASRRMRGDDKLLQLVDGIPLLRQQVQRACTASANIIVTLPPPPHPRYEAISGFKNVCVVPVSDPEKGMSASLKAALEATGPDHEYAMVLLPDMPDIDEHDIEMVLAAVSREQNALIWRGATDGGQPGHPIVFRKSLFPELMKVAGDQGGSSVVKKYKKETVLVPLPATMNPICPHG